MEVLSIDNKIMTVNGKLAKAPSTTGTGDMKKSVYDPTGSVATAGGIPDYVEANGGKIDIIKVNGTAQTITDKTVNIVVPTKTSDIVNDSGYINSAQVPVQSVNGKTGVVTVREVPSVTTSDNGKFLRVVNGAWAVAEVANASGVSF